MALVIIIDLIVLMGLVYLAQSKQGLERALPFATFLIVLVPSESLLPLGFFTLTTHRVIVTVLGVLYLSDRGRLSRANRFATPLKGLILAHAIWFILSTAGSIVPSQSIKKTIALVFEYSTLYAVYLKSVTKVATLHKILMAIVLAITICCVCGVAETYRGWTPITYFPTVGHHWDDRNDADRAVRIQTTYGHPILYGAALAMAIVLSLYLLTVMRSRAQQVVLWGGLALMYFNLYKTSSRGPWLDGALGCALLMAFGPRRSRRALAYIGLLGGVVLVARPGIWDTINGLYENTFSADTGTGSSYLYRQALLDAATHRLQGSSIGRLIWGYGPESFYDVHIEGMLVGKPHVFLSCDNTWVQFLVEIGLGGLAIMIVLLMKPAWLAAKQYLRLPAPARYLSLTMCVVFVIWYFQMYSVSMYTWGQNAYTLWILFAVTLAYPRLLTTRGIAKDSPVIRAQGTKMFGSSGWPDADDSPKWPRHAMPTLS